MTHVSTYWIDSYLAIKNRLRVQLEELVNDEGDLVFKRVYFGKKITAKEFPCCIFWPIIVRTTVTTANSSQYPMRFRVCAIAQDQTPEGGHDEAVTMMGYVGKMIEDDRQFGFLADTSEIDEIDPDVRRPRVRTRHEAAYILRFERYVLPQ